MTPAARRAAVAAALAALLGLGFGLRLFRWRDAPPGPWIDEALALRAARASASAPLLGTTPLQPPDAGFVNSWLTNLSLRGLGAIDRAAGGGMASVRAMSILPALVLLLAIVAVAAEASGGRAGPVLVAALLASTSSWLLVTGRWGWNAVATSAVVVLAAALGLRAARKASPVLAAAAGALLGLSFWGYVAAWALLPLPPLLVVAALARRDGSHEAARRARAAAAGLLACVLVAAPLALHYAAHPERAVARARELSAARAGSPGLLPALARNAAAYARLFTVGGDPNERHGDPERPVLPVVVTALALAGTADGLRRGGAARLLALVAALFLAASLLAVEEAANAYRAVHAAPFLLVLAALGATRLVELAGPPRRPFATAVLGLLLVAVALLDVAGFLRWLSSPRLYGAFGGPERDLADAVSAELASRGPADVVLAPGAARNAFVVDALLQSPRSARPAIRQAAAPGALRYVPARDVLFADAATGERAGAFGPLGALAVSSGGVLPGHPGWALWRIPAARAAGAAEAFAEAFPRVPSPGAGSFLAPEEGLYTFASRGGAEARLDGEALFGAARPAGSVTARLAAGRHDLSVRALAPGALLRVTAPDGFLLPPP
ncbi:MAG: hypothetical protein U0529_20805 [Thermoanaerobaculia bacterium]